MKVVTMSALGCLLAAAFLSTQINPDAYREGYSRDPLLRAEVNQSSLARILGEFRTGASDMLFIKTERYLHSGVGYVPHLTEDLLTVQGTDKGVDEHLAEMGDAEEDVFEHEEEAEVLVPRAESDYRGWIGDMHREIKPWLDPSIPHRHTDGKELIPWFKMMTLSDPGYIRGYVVGAFWLKRHQPEAAMAFIEEGLKENPEAFQLHLSKGMLLLSEARKRAGKGKLPGDTPESLEKVLLAKDAVQLAATYMLSSRPPLPEQGDITDDPGWGKYEESDAMAAVNLSVMLESDFGDPETAQILREQFRPLMPDNPRLQ